MTGIFPGWTGFQSRQKSGEFEGEIGGARPALAPSASICCGVLLAFLGRASPFIRASTRATLRVCICGATPSCGLEEQAHPLPLDALTVSCFQHSASANAVKAPAARHSASARSYWATERAAVTNGH